MDRLLAATVSVIGENGLAAVSIPQIAVAAGLSTGAIYRRFTDKDALIRTAILQFLENAQKLNRQALTPERFAEMDLQETLFAICRALVRQYREHPILLKALDQFLESQSDEAFRKRMIDLIEANIRCVIDVLMLYREKVATSRPERAIKFALLSALTLIEGKVLHQSALWQRILPLSDEDLVTETVQIMTAYLTTKAPPKKTKSKK